MQMAEMIELIGEAVAGRQPRIRRAAARETIKLDQALLSELEPDPSFAFSIKSTDGIEPSSAVQKHPVDTNKLD